MIAQNRWQFNGQKKFVKKETKEYKILLDSTSPTPYFTSENATPSQKDNSGKILAICEKKDYHSKVIDFIWRTLWYLSQKKSTWICS